MAERLDVTTCTSLVQARIGSIADVAYRKRPLLFTCKFKLCMLFTHPAGKMWVKVCILQGICIGSMPNFPSVYVFIIIFKT